MTPHRASRLTPHPLTPHPLPLSDPFPPPPRPPARPHTGRSKIRRPVRGHRGTAEPFCAVFRARRARPRLARWLHAHAHAVADDAGAGAAAVGAGGGSRGRGGSGGRGRVLVLDRRARHAPAAAPSGARTHARKRPTPAGDPRGLRAPRGPRPARPPAVAPVPPRHAAPTARRSLTPLPRSRVRVHRRPFPLAVFLGRVGRTHAQGGTDSGAPHSPVDGSSPHTLSPALSNPLLKPSLTHLAPQRMSVVCRCAPASGSNLTVVEDPTGAADAWYCLVKVRVCGVWVDQPGSPI